MSVDAIALPRAHDKHRPAAIPGLPYLVKMENQNLASKSHSYICLKPDPHWLLNASRSVLFERFAHRRKVRCIPLIV